MAALRTEYPKVAQPLPTTARPMQSQQTRSAVRPEPLSRTAEEEFKIEPKPPELPPAAAVPENPQSEKYQITEAKPKIDALL